MKKIVLLLALSFTSFIGNAQEQANQSAPKAFMQQLCQLVGKAFKGNIVSTPVPNDFKDKELIMYVMSCQDNQIKIPFFVGEDLSRTWVFTQDDRTIELKHDHRHEDGSPDKLTMYGGKATNTGMSDIQFFPADQQTVDMLPSIAGNVWYVTVNKQTFTYNLKRVDRTSQFSVEFDLTKPVITDKRPW
ncbi:hypothetical protein [Myroides pelagicus]|uniref:DUF4251 domain-containing protein n=1 Tax=Myroides pelagicus TaxID=270914 RepID=A0A7K1GHI6_9FLAO|nr:hypothetical protein [Myroides pelagicus]MTH28340.1 hypothetical protein [Myroides pelagicus]